MKQSLKNEMDVLSLMNKMQAQLFALDRKIDTLISRSLPETKLVQKAPVNTAPLPVKHHDRPKERVMFTAICADCKKECKIPFKPSGDRPVYCQDCFSRRKVISLSGIKIDDKPKELGASQASIVKEVTASKAPIKAKKKAVAVKKAVKKSKLAPKKK